MKLTLEETRQRLHELAENNLRKREAIGVEGDNTEYVTLINALAYLG
jgi:PHD/YefM family antitoxin component YafN of YafNO toxin-antitoxin module